MEGSLQRHIDCRFCLQAMLSATSSSPCCKAGAGASLPEMASPARRCADCAALWVHVFRYVALRVFAAQQHGFPISDAGAMEVVVGDLAGAVPAFAAIALCATGGVSPSR